MIGGSIVSNRAGLCWHCIKRDKCSMFKKNPNATTVDCGLFKADPEEQKRFIEIAKTMTEIEEKRG